MKHKKDKMIHQEYLKLLNYLEEDPEEIWDKLYSLKRHCLEVLGVDEKKCCLCDGPYYGNGNNALPVGKGRCCDDCNFSLVVPARVLQSIMRRR